MKLSLYIKNYLINDIILLLILSGLFYLASDIYHQEKIDEDSTVELVPLNIDPNEEIG